ncbi:MAG: hypothetical protein V1794_12570 [Candidatus Glassbacteria bacterium]
MKKKSDSDRQSEVKKSSNRDAQTGRFVVVGKRSIKGRFSSERVKSTVSEVLKKHEGAWRELAKH